jgi:hypothetical protein
LWYGLKLLKTCDVIRPVKARGRNRKNRRKHKINKLPILKEKVSNGKMAIFV